MSETIAFYLPLILFAPWFGVLAGLFCYYPRQPDGRPRRIYDCLALLLSLVVSVIAAWLAFGTADLESAPIWPQVLASLYVYGGFLIVLLLAWWLRGRLLGTPGRAGDG